ncbi:MAG: TonB-dependent receptor [Epsilonproteobacteria bacterium]|nr:TonB-dependent receptor [Campylobacterota bacterium]
MKKRTLFLALSAVAYAESLSVDKIVVEEKINTVTVKNLSSEELKSADLAEALAKNAPSVSLVRRSGIANDIILRGQKRDNITVIIDGTKVCGACINRMDPPTSHVATHIVDNVEIQEGPFDVENFGTLSGKVEINTKEPENGFGGEINLNAGSFDSKKGSLTLHGGNADIKALVTVASEKSGQYEDGDGNDFAQQLINMTNGTSSQGAQYQPKYADLDAFEKSTLMAKIFAHISENQDLRLSYTANRNDNILYPSTPMDAIWDDSDIYNLEYQIRALGKYSDVLDFQIYNSQVDHPMSIKYRKKAVATNPLSGMPYGDITNHLTTEMTGVKLKNSFDLSNTMVTFGLDTSKRKWDGQYYQSVSGSYMQYMASSSTPGAIKYSLNDTETVNKALFVKTHSKLGNIDLDFGARYDDTSIENGGSAQNSDFDSISANIFVTINVNEGFRYFAGIGKSTRVPDPRELYFQSSMAPNGNTYVGTPTLDQTSNYEVDFGFEKIYERFTLKTKLFYSMLKDYIYLNGQKKVNAFTNIDATIYGAEISGAYLATQSLYLDYALAYKRGEKDDPLEGQSDTDLAEISPLRAVIGLGYDYDSTLGAKLDVIGVSDWDDYDADNGEQALDGYIVLNLKVNKEFSNGIGITVGVDNILDETYTTTNTYKDLTLISTGAEINEIMLLNEPGRYFYLNASYKF